MFDEIKIDGLMIAVAKAVSNIFKSVSGITGLQETILESSTENLRDVDNMDFDKHYGFEICTEKYRKYVS